MRPLTRRPGVFPSYGALLVAVCCCLAPWLVAGGVLCAWLAWGGR